MHLSESVRVPKTLKSLECLNWQNVMWASNNSDYPEMRAKMLYRTLQLACSADAMCLCEATCPS